MGRKAPRKRLACRVMARPTGASHAPERLSALRPPLDSGERSNDAKPRAQKTRRGNEMGCLTSWAGLNAMLSSSWGARMLKRTRKVRTGVRASRRMRTSRCVRPHASRRIAARFGCGSSCIRIPLRCSSAWGRGAKHQPAAVGNDRRLRSLVSGLLFTMDGATPTCRAVGCAPPRTVGRCRMGRGSKGWLGAREEAGGREVW